MNIQNFKSIKIWIVAIFTLMTLCTFPISSFATIIVTETYDGLADWHCIVAGSAGISGSIWTSQSGCTYRNYNGFSHYGGEITTPGRGGGQERV